MEICRPPLEIVMKLRVESLSESVRLCCCVLFSSYEEECGVVVVCG